MKNLTLIATSALVLLSIVVLLSHRPVRAGGDQIEDACKEIESQAWTHNCSELDDVRSILLSQKEVQTLLADTGYRASEHILERLQHLDEMAHPDNAVAAYGIVLRTWPQRDYVAQLNSQLGDIEWRRKYDLFWSISLLSEGRDACEAVSK